MTVWFRGAVAVIHPANAAFEERTLGNAVAELDEAEALVAARIRELGGYPVVQIQAVDEEQVRPGELAGVAVLQLIVVRPLIREERHHLRVRPGDRRRQAVKRREEGQHLR